MPDPPATLQQREIELIADFMIAKIVGKGPMNHAKCVEFWGSETRGLQGVREVRFEARLGLYRNTVVWLLSGPSVRTLRTGEDLASIRQRDAVGVGGVAAVLSRETLYGDLVSLFQ